MYATDMSLNHFKMREIYFITKHANPNLRVVTQRNYGVKSPVA